MEHVVFYPTPDGAPAFRRLASLDEAVRLVEHLRNVEGVSQVSCHALTEVPLAFRAYYRVEVDGEQVVPLQAEPGGDQQPLAAVADHVLTPVPDLPGPDQEPERHLVVAQAGVEGQAGGGAKSLGFFA